jgi:pimeloyl-ACP methyl ester carboxylesterase
VRRRHAILLAAIAATAVITWKAVRAAQLELAAFHPKRGPVARPADAPADLVDVRFGAGVAAFWVPSKTGAAVMLAHASSADRSQLAYELRLLAAHGYGVLAFDWPGHGESDGTVTLGRAEKDAVRAAVDWLVSQPSVQSARIGGLGFSMGAALLLATAQDEPRLRALVLEGAFTDAIEQTAYECRGWGPITRWPGLWVVRRNVEGGNLRPIDGAEKLKGRTKVLAIAGTDDGTVPPSMSEEIARVTGGDVWLVPRCKHGGYQEAAPVEYDARVLAFFDRALASAPHE